MSRLAVPVVVVLALALSASASAASNPTTVNKVRTGPSGTAFYTPPSPLPGKQHGDLIWARTLSGAAVAAGAASTKVVLYRSQGIDGKADAVSGIVSIPKGKVPKHGWPVITYAHGTTGVADQCAPSRDVAGTPVHPYNAYVLPLVTRWLKAGYAVVRTDYEGLGTAGVHPYLIGSSEGRATLDIARAARQLDPRLSKTTIISGHSQGGHAALWAAALAPKWTPDLKLRGTVAFAPAAHLEDQIPITSSLTSPGAGLSGLISDIVRGLDAAYPHASLASDLTDAATAFYPQTLDQCLPELSTPASFGGLAPKDIFKPGTDFAPISKLLKANDPATLTIKTPLRIEQGAADTTVIPIFTDQLATELTKNGNKGLTYKKYPGVDHAGIVDAAAKDATAWIAKRLK
jgi:pimeloyl-ACP methyl ester carboxylesterase